MDSIDKRLKHLEDERAIQQVIHNYGFTTDHLYIESWLDNFTDDAVLIFKATPDILSRLPFISKLIEKPITGREQLAEFVSNMAKTALPTSKHVTANTIISIQGDEAAAHSNLVHFIDQKGIPELVSTGRYVDKFRRCADGRWRIGERIAHMDSIKAMAIPSDETNG